MTATPADIPQPFRRALLESIPCAVLALDEDGRVIFWNQSAQQLTGYSADEVLGSTCEMLRVRLSPHPDREAIAAVCPGGASGTWQAECEIRRKDGQTVSIARRWTTVTDQAGQPLGAIQAMVDITAIKQARAEIRILRDQVARSAGMDELVGSSEPMVRLYEAISLVADTDASVLISGPTGTGKELVARTIHNRSDRREEIFLAVNCGALPETLLAAELFGHAKGAFTGATADRPGRFEQAHGGTLLLDEIGELPLEAQVKLLRAVQEGEITRVGEAVPRKVDVRILAATNRDLAGEVRAGRFREDLYYRLRVVELRVPALRDRSGDIPDLVRHFLGRLERKYGRDLPPPSGQAMDALMAYDWPGNVRQLAHALEHAVVVSRGENDALPLWALPPEIVEFGRGQTVGPPARPPSPEPSPPASPPASSEPPGEDERARVQAALKAENGNKTRAARRLGLTRAGLYKKLKRLGLDG